MAGKERADQAKQHVGPDPIDEAIGRRLREAREARQLTQQAVSTRSKWADPAEKGVSRTALIGYEAGTSRPGTRELRILCETLKVTPNEIVFGTDAPFQQTATEGLGWSASKGLSQSIQLALVLASMKGHERDALISLALSLAGRQLGDRRLSGLRGFAVLLTPAVAAQLKTDLPGIPDDASLDDIVDVLSRQVDMTIGNDLLFDEDGEVTGGRVTYPDPSAPVDQMSGSATKKSH